MPASSTSRSSREIPISSSAVDREPSHLPPQESESTFPASPVAPTVSNGTADLPISTHVFGSFSRPLKRLFYTLLVTIISALCLAIAVMVKEKFAYTPSPSPTSL